MKIVAMDIETDALDARRIWVICTQDTSSGEKNQFLNVDTIPEERQRFIDYIADADRFVLHNGIGFDVPVLNRMLDGVNIDYDKVIDTMIVSRLVDFSVEGGHSLKAWGQRLGNYKTDYSDWSHLNQEMIDYCHQDVTVTVELYKKFRKVIEDPEWQEALKCEHQIQRLCEQMTENGFYFNQTLALSMLDVIKARMEELETGFQQDFPPKLEVVNTIKYRLKKDNTPVASVDNARSKYVMTKVDNSVNPPDLHCYDFVSFNPASPKQRIDRLWEAGWEPVEKTKGHIEYEREKQRANRRAWR